jgi:hypothetical protein
LIMKWITVIGSANKNERVRRADAQFYVNAGMAVWSGDNHIRLVKSHPANIAARNRASFVDNRPPTEVIVPRISRDRRLLQGGLCNSR